jgi:hypothetical protein
VLQKAVECCRILQLGAASNLELIRGRRLQRGGAAGGRQGDDGGGRDAQRKPVRLWARVYVGVCACVRACFRALSRVRACLCLFRRGCFSSCLFLAVFAVLVVLAVMAVSASVLSLARVCRRGWFSCLCASVCVCARACVRACVRVCVCVLGHGATWLCECPSRRWSSSDSRLRYIGGRAALSYLANAVDQASRARPARVCPRASFLCSPSAARGQTMRLESQADWEEWQRESFPRRWI